MAASSFRTLRVPEATHKARLLGGESRANLLETLKKVNFDQVLGAKLGDMLFCFSKSVKLNYIYIWYIKSKGNIERNGGERPVKEKFIKQVTLEEESRQTVKTRVKMLWVSEDKMREMNYTAKLDLLSENKLV